jgi:hypothetical protein
MMLSASPEAQIDPAGLTTLAPDSPEYFGVLASWLTAAGLTHPREEMRIVIPRAA